MENKRFYLTIKGKQVEVTEEVYRAYVRPIRTEQRRKRREWRCRIKGKNGKLIRCPYKCSQCEYAKAGGNAMGNTLSLDVIKDAGIEIEDKQLDLETDYIDQSDRKKIKELVLLLTERQQEIVRLRYFEELTEQEIAEIYGITQQAVHNALKKILKKLKKNFSIRGLLN